MTGFALTFWHFVDEDQGVQKMAKTNGAVVVEDVLLKWANRPMNLAPDGCTLLDPWYAEARMNPRGGRG